ncbi:flagellar protein FlaG [Modicisalibacter ilicicola DSM 19980]|uniref:Flagellar protein FlaG n=1 Tax=Modicisalibacter ilicicola DSM 19980 TaxID=1121942 RepID=A0A1M4YY43_9GAMM|nr:flagellar protein FlaG [Halomonas ilicicola]SHF10721.1 flagellar protein FlaG [Halomonas ilicicola DSM 19980]
MMPPVYDISPIGSTSVTANLTPRQRLESVLSHLPAPSSRIMEQQGVDALAAPDDTDLVKPLERVNEVMRGYGIEFDLQRHEGRVVTRIVDRESGELIRQIPSEEVLRIAESLEQLQGRLIRLEV